MSLYTLFQFINTSPIIGTNTNVVNIYVSQSVTGSHGATQTFAQAMTIPNISSDNGKIQTYIQDAKEIVLNYEKYPLNSTASYSRGYYNIEIETRKKLVDYWYLKFKDQIEIPTNSFTLNIATGSITPYTIGFVPSNEAKFLNSDYNVLMSNVFNIRQSKKRLVVDREAYTPSIGAYSQFLLPVNFELLSSSFQDNVLSNLPERVFASVQDSMYSNTGWSNARYNGSLSTGPFGDEPALTYEFFEGATFPSSSEAVILKAIFSSSIVETNNKFIYHTTYFKEPGTEAPGPSGSFSMYFTDLTDRQSSKLLPYSYKSKDILTYVSGSQYTFFHLRNKKTRKLERLTDAKTYNIQTGKVYSTDDEGKVIKIE